MKRLYVFRLDGSKANDAFFALRCRRESGVVAYQGRSITFGRGWTPDLIEVETEESGTAVVTLVELDLTQTAAIVSCRKYLPEASAGIMERFAKYLSRVEELCEATADPRHGDIRVLKELLEGEVRVTVRTAGALRTGDDYCEMYALMDQPERLSRKTREKEVWAPEFGPGAKRVFSRREVDSLRRAVRVLHAVLVGKDLAVSPFKRWKTARFSPLDRTIREDRGRHPAVEGLLRHYAFHGMRIDFDEVAEEMADLWRQATGDRWTPGAVGKAIAQFAGVCAEFNLETRMQKWFDVARAALGQAGWRGADTTAIRRRRGRRSPLAA